MAELRDRMVREMRLRNLSPRTEEAYIGAVVGLAKHYGASPDQLTLNQVKDYLLYLVEVRGLKFGTVNRAHCAFRFLYEKTLGYAPIDFKIPYQKKEQALPDVLSVQERERLFDAVGDNLKHRVLLMTAYSAGLRSSEVVSLKRTDIDSDRMMIRVELGKGRKDRYTLLSKRLLKELRVYEATWSPPVYLFPGRIPTRPMRQITAGKIFKKAKKRAGITKIGGLHMLRHTFATDLLEAGVDIATIQKLMGHRSIKTTMRYLRITDDKLTEISSPLDLHNEQGKDENAPE